ncbi:MAG: hypothetical protein AAF266_12095 [Planctomycetota bacterium]
MPFRHVFAAMLATLPANCCGVVIDDFTAGPITVTTNGDRFDEVFATQDGLPTDQVASGGRDFRVQQRDEVISLAVDPSDGGRLIYQSGGLSGINTFLNYVAAEPIDLAPSGENALVLSFESTAFDFEFFPGRNTLGFLDLTIDSPSGGSYDYIAVRSSAEPFNLAIPFSLLGRFDPRAFTRLQLGTSNGNLHGSFALSAITTEQLAPADYNGDGSIDAADYTAWRDNADPERFYRYQGDGNGDGLVDPADYLVWQAAYGGGNAASVPEPAAIALALLATLALARRAQH